MFSQAAEHIGGHLPLCKQRLHTAPGCPPTESRGRGHSALKDPAPLRRLASLTSSALERNATKSETTPVKSVKIRYCITSTQLVSNCYSSAASSFLKNFKSEVTFSKQRGRGKKKKNPVTLRIICLLSQRMTKT